MRRALFAALVAAACARPEPKTTRFTVEGMVCGSCEAAICARVEKLPGVLACQADHVRGAAEVRHDPASAPADVIAAAIASLGYPAAPESP